MSNQPNFSLGRIPRRRLRDDGSDHYYIGLKLAHNSPKTRHNEGWETGRGTVLSHFLMPRLFLRGLRTTCWVCLSFSLSCFFGYTICREVELKKGVDGVDQVDLFLVIVSSGVFEMWVCDYSVFWPYCPKMFVLCPQSNFRSCSSCFDGSKFVAITHIFYSIYGECNWRSNFWWAQPMTCKQELRTQVWCQSTPLRCLTFSRLAVKKTITNSRYWNGKNCLPAPCLNEGFCRHFRR